MGCRQSSSTLYIQTIQVKSPSKMHSTLISVKSSGNTNPHVRVTTQFASSSVPSTPTMSMKKSLSKSSVRVQQVKLTESKSSAISILSPSSKNKGAFSPNNIMINNINNNPKNKNNNSKSYNNNNNKSLKENKSRAENKKDKDQDKDKENDPHINYLVSLLAESEAQREKRESIETIKENLVKSTWNEAKKLGMKVPKIFYLRLFETDHSAAELFKGTNMEEQGVRLVRMFDIAIGKMKSIEDLFPVVRKLGHAHKAFGVTTKHYDSVGAALLWTLKQGLGVGFTRDVASAWKWWYGVLSDVMLSGNDQNKSTNLMYGVAPINNIKQEETVLEIVAKRAPKQFTFNLN